MSAMVIATHTTTIGAGMASKRDLQGRVQGVNANGVNIDGTWFNYSKFFKGERTPAKGASVSAVIGEFNGKDYLNELTVIGSALPQAASVSTPSSYAGRSADTDKRIARQVALKAAVDFRKGEVIGEAGVIATAREFERFLSESYETVSVEDAA